MLRKEDRGFTDVVSFVCKEVTAELTEDVAACDVDEPDCEVEIWAELDTSACGTVIVLKSRDVTARSVVNASG